jgi:hypothetical protein
MEWPFRPFSRNYFWRMIIRGEYEVMTLALISSVFANVVAMEKLSIEQLNTNDGKYELK